MARILVVDDDPDFVEIVRMILQAEGYSVDTASNGSMALRMVQESPPDLVLLDVMMAGVLDGVHVAHEISENAALHGIPLIMISSIINSPMADMFPTDEYIPIDDWISKPVQPEDLIRKVGRLIGD
jgi:two-component system sensor histidine kinase/response regulator